MYKKLLALMLALCMSMVFMAGCGSQQEAAPEEEPAAAEETAEPESTATSGTVAYNVDMTQYEKGKGRCRSARNQGILLG